MHPPNSSQVSVFFKFPSSSSSSRLQSPSHQVQVLFSLFETWLSVTTRSNALFFSPIKALSRLPSPTFCIRTMDADRYIEILRRRLLPFLHEQDKDPKHTSKKAQDFLTAESINWCMPVQLLCCVKQRACSCLQHRLLHCTPARYMCNA